MPCIHRYFPDQQQVSTQRADVLLQYCFRTSTV
jgi:hypothetical protein